MSPRQVSEALFEPGPSTRMFDGNVCRRVAPRTERGEPRSARFPLQAAEALVSGGLLGLVALVTATAPTLAVPVNLWSERGGVKWGG